jgi:hypothetical protein
MVTIANDLTEINSNTCFFIFTFFSFFFKAWQVKSYKELQGEGFVFPAVYTIDNDRVSEEDEDDFKKEDVIVVELWVGRCQMHK